MGIKEMDKILSHKLFNHLYALFSLFIVFLIFLIILIWQKFNNDALLILSIIFVIDALPALYLHIEYWLENYGNEYEILPDRIIFNKRGRITTYLVKDIKEIFIYKSASIDKGGIPFAAFESYYYARIITKSGEELIITCLLTPKVEEVVRQLRGVPIIRKKRFFFNLDWK